ncbi:hypothetical protein BKA70DRAFT_1101952, partial [Coprinopsis sp. MPI-PUGE-AT-0042]
TKDKSVPEPSKETTDKARWLQCTIRNATDFPILAEKAHFDSGRYNDNPGRVDAFEVGTFTACNGDNTFMTGVSGGQTYKIAIDEHHSFVFSIGFTNPWAGSYKAGVVESSNPEKGYEAASQAGGSIESPLYEAKDHEGEDIRFKLHISATASQRPAFVVSEIRY